MIVCGQWWGIYTHTNTMHAYSVRCAYVHQLWIKRGKWKSGVLCVCTRARVGQKWKWRQWQRQLENWKESAMRRRHRRSIDRKLEVARLYVILFKVSPLFNHMYIHVVHAVLKCHQVETVNWPGFVSTHGLRCGHLIVIGLRWQN